MSKLAEKVQDIKKIVKILHSLSAEYVKKLVVTLSRYMTVRTRDLSKRIPLPFVV